jgi:serine/threonine-protein kinase
VSDPAERTGGTLGGEDAAEREARARRARLRRTLAFAVVASAAALVAIGLWTYGAVERSLRASQGAALRSVLEAQAKTLEVWIEDQKLGIRRLARDRQVREHAQALTALAAQHAARPQQYCAAPARRPLVEQLDEALAGSGAVAFNIVDRAGRIVASKFPAYCGLQMRAEAFEQSLAPVFRGETRFIRPYGESGRLTAPPPDPPLDRALVWVETPIADASGRILGALGVGQFAHEQFAAILAAARSHDTDEVYAFDRDGVLLSESRFASELAARGMLPKGAPSALAVVLRPPGAPQAGRTRLAAAARERDASRGLLLDPYPGYYGREVVGAWRWLENYDMGIAIEIGADEAYAPLQVLGAAFGVVFGALVIAVMAALYAWFSAAKLRSEVGQRRVGAYVLGERIGEGGAGNVYLARHDLLKRPTAVKLLKTSRSTDEMTARFEREAQLASQLSHPNMVEIYDYGRAEDGSLYYAMEHLEGETIGKLVLAQGALPLARAVHLLRQVCAGLAEAHGKNLVHRDISPNNIMVCRYGGEYDFVKILDFGLVKNFATREETITRSLRILGTLLYMAPERLRDPADVDPRADIYAVGALAFFLLTGRRMFETLEDIALTSKVLNEVPPHVSAVAAQPIPGVLDYLIAACLEKRREDRPARITDLSDILDALALLHRWTQRDAQAAWYAQRASPDLPSAKKASSA